MSLQPPEFKHVTEDALREWKSSTSSGYKLPDPVPLHRFIYEQCWAILRGDLPLHKCKVALDSAQFFSAAGQHPISAEEIAFAFAFAFADIIAHLVEDPMMSGEEENYQRMQVKDFVPFSLYHLSALLVKAGLIDLDTHLLPTDAAEAFEHYDAFLAKRMEAFEHYDAFLAKTMDKVNKIGRVVNLAATGKDLLAEERHYGTTDLFLALDMEKEAVWEPTAELDNNQCLGFLAVDDWHHANILFHIFSHLNPVEHVQVSVCFISFIENTISPVVYSIVAYQMQSLNLSAHSAAPPPAAARMDHSHQMSDALLPSSSFDLPAQLFQMLSVAGPYLYRPPLLVQDICRVLRVYYYLSAEEEEEEEDICSGMSGRLTNAVGEMVVSGQAHFPQKKGTTSLKVEAALGTCILSSLQLIPANPSIGQEIWQLMCLLPYQARYRLYGEWEKEAECLPLVLAARQVAKLETRRIPKRLAKENANVDLVHNALTPTMYAQLISTLYDLVRKFHLEPKAVFLMVYRPITRLFKSRSKPEEGFWPVDYCIEESNVQNNSQDNLSADLALDLGQSHLPIFRWSELIVTIRSMLPPNACNSLSPELYATFWGLNLHHLYVPIGPYESEIAKKRGALKSLEEEQLSDNSSSAISKRKKDEERIQQLVDKLRFNMEFFQRCIFPRCIFSMSDAVYCATFVHTLHSLGTPFFNTVHHIDIFICKTLHPMICCCSEYQAGRLGRFLYEALKMAYTWKIVSVFHLAIYYRFPNKPGFAIYYRFPNTRCVSFSQFVRIHIKWSSRLFIQCSESTEYMEIRNALVTLVKISGVFPVTRKSGINLEKRMVKIKSDGIKVLATSVSAALAARKSSWVSEQEFRMGYFIPKAPASPAKPEISLKDQGLQPKISDGRHDVSRSRPSHSPFREDSPLKYSDKKQKRRGIMEDQDRHKRRKVENEEHIIRGLPPPPPLSPSTYVQKLSSPRHDGKDHRHSDEHDAKRRREYDAKRRREDDAKRRREVAVKRRRREDVKI